MMRRFLICAILLIVPLAHAQHTTVTAQVKDPFGITYRTCTGSANFLGQNTTPGSGPYRLGGSTFQTVVPISCDSFGIFTISLADNNQVTPTPSQWNFSICTALGVFTGPPICFNAPVTITGTTQDVSAALQAAAAPLPVAPTVSFKTNGVLNGTQSLLNLIQGSNITLIDNGIGGVTISSTGGGGGGGTPGSPTNTLQANVGGNFVATTDANTNATTSFDQTTGMISPCNLDNIRYVSCYNWTRGPAGALTGGVPATVTLTPGPRGIDTTANATFPFYVYVAGTGTPEAVLVTGGTCNAAGSASCTIAFTPANSHTAGFTVQSATSGAAEAEFDALSTNTETAKLSFRPAGSQAGNNTFAYIFYAPMFVRCGDCVLDGGGATIVLNNKRAIFVLPSNTINVKDTIRDFRAMPEVTLAGAAITNTVCSANVATINSTLQPAVGDVVDIEFTFTTFYWGPHVVTTSSPTQWTYTATGCSQPSQATAGLNGYQAAVIEDNGQDNLFDNIHMTFGGAPYNQTWNNGIVVLNDQEVVINHFVMDGHGSCGALYCGSAIYAPGTFSTGPAVLKISESGISPGCSMNGVTNYNGNTTSVTNTVIQGYPMWGIWGGTQRGGFGGIIATNVYEEVGACTNPIYTPNQQAGIGQSGQTVTWHGGEGGLGATPQFATGGATTYFYYLVVHDSGGTQSAPFYIGSAIPSVATLSVRWPRANDSNTQTYDIIRTTDGNNAPTTTACVGGSTSACGSRVLAQAQCATLQCSFTDDVTQNTASYSVLLPEFTGSGLGGATYNPLFAYFPGNFILQGNASLNYQGGNIAGSNMSSPGGVMATNGVGPIMTDAGGGVVRSYLRVNSTRFTSGGGQLRIIDPVHSSGTTANSVGTIALLNPSPGTAGHSYGQGSYLVTLASPKSDQIIAAANASRDVIADPNDSGIGLDSAGSNAALYRTGYSSPTGHAFYVGSLLNGVTWKALVGPVQTEFNTPTQFDQPMNALLNCTDCSAFNRTTPFTSDTFNRAAAPLGGNWTNIDGTWSTVSGAAFPGIFYGYFDTLVNDGGVQRAATYYSGTSFTSDQIVQAQITPANSLIGICARMQNAAPLTAYCFSSGSNLRTLTKFVAGVGTALFSAGTNIPNASIVRITALGSIITATVNGVQFAQVTDNTITGGAPGLYGQNFVTTAQGISNFYATSAGWTAVESLTASTITSAANGGISGTEGTGVGVPAGANLDTLWPDSSAHRWKMNNNNTGAVNVLGSTDFVLQDCGTTSTCANTVKDPALMVRGSVAFPTATTVTVTGLPFTSAASYSCTAGDATTAAGVINATTYTSGASVTFTETGGVNTDTMRYVCIGF